jgi:DNA-directed RNA polymerase subunit RPC12/RpoP
MRHTNDGKRGGRMSDMIKRSDAIKAVNRAKAEGMTECPTYYLGTVPSADRPQGEWIEDYNGNGWNDYWDYTCSNCGKRYERADAVLCKANFCPNCGAKMKGADDE